MKCCRLYCILFIQMIQTFRLIFTDETGDPLQNQYGTLKHASILHRHGERSPITPYPSDPHKDYHWPNGYGQLQNTGKRRMVEVGKWLRMRYRNFIDDTFKHGQAHIESSSLTRCVMSVQCLLYGLYPATGEQIWMENEAWQPIPVYPIPKHDDNKLLYSRKCKLLSVLAKQEAKDTKYADTYNEYEKIIERVLNETGTDATKKTQAQLFWHLSHIFDTLKVEAENNLTLPDWTKNVYPEPLSTIILRTEWHSAFNELKSRLRAGPFLKSVITDMERKIADEKYEQKLHVYSAHDSTIWSVMIGLKVYDNRLPAYGSTLIFELREKNSTNYVTISYRNDTNAPDARLLDVPGCGLTCTFEQFYDSIKPIIPEHWDSECDSDLPARLMVMVVFFYILMRLRSMPETWH